MLINLIEIKKELTGQYRLEDVFVNPKHVILLREDPYYKKDLKEGRIDLDINSNVEFTRLVIPSDKILELTVVGSPASVRSKLYNQKILLKD